MARAPADGRTLLFATAETHAINPHIYRKLGYDPLKDFVTVGVVDSFPFALVSSPKVPATTLGDFVRYAKDHGAQMNYEGVPVVIGGWHVLAAPRGTPAAAVKRLNAALNAVTGAEAVRERLLKQGVRPASSTPEAAQAMVEAEWKRWGDVAKAAAVSAD